MQYNAAISLCIFCLNYNYTFLQIVNYKLQSIIMMSDSGGMAVSVWSGYLNDLKSEVGNLRQFNLT